MGANPLPREDDDFAARRNGVPRRGGSAAKRAPRRLSRDARREQLVDAAMPLIVEQGTVAFSLDELAHRADVTRNLLYHYFPRGRPDILLAAAERAGHELTDGWLTDGTTPLRERMARNFQRFIDSSQVPSDAWVVHRLGRAANEPELLRIIDRFEEVVVRGVSLNNFGTAEPPPIVRLAIKGFIAFAESVLDEARAAGIPRERVVQVVAETLRATLEAISPNLA